MLKINKTTNLTAQILVESEAKGAEAATEQVAYLNATVYEDGNININKVIQNMELFNTNKEAVLADMKTFEDTVYAEKNIV